ncbi:MAG: hypothetical protein AAB568_03050 [Patescibacteria group bacterium]
MKILAAFYVLMSVVLLVLTSYAKDVNHLATLYGGAIGLIFTAGVMFYLFAKDREFEEKMAAKKEALPYDDLVEGTVKKGGVNRMPTTPRPPTPPLGQGEKTEAKGE